MRRLYLAASGLGLSALVAIAAANPPAEPASAATDETATPVATAAVPSESVLPSTNDSEAVLRQNYLRLTREHESLTAALTTTRNKLQELEANDQLNAAQAMLTHITKNYPQTSAAGRIAQAEKCLEAITDVGTPAAADVAPIDPTLPAFIDFGMVVVNLDEGRLNRYLQVNIHLQVTEGEHAEMLANVAAQKVVLKDWLISYLSEQSLEDVRGSNAHDRLRREIREHFNTLLFPAGDHDIDQVLFQEFTVQ